MDPAASSTSSGDSIPLERKRIESLGCRVKNGRIDGQLAVSRALGDFAFKSRAHGPENHLVLARPDVSVLDRNL
jgi:serine/threonine protein phosphatase PrpC